MSEEINKESLHKSITLVGELYPILENQDGKILDGNTRAASNPKHHRKTIQTKSRTEEILIRVHAHHRRRICQEETRTILYELACEFEKSGVVKEKVAQEVAKVVPYSESYVLQLLPGEFKEPRKVEAGRISAELTEQKKVEQTVSTPKVNTQKHECNYCHITNGEAREWNGHYLCQRDFAKALDDPAKFHRYFDLLDKGRQVMRDKENHSTKPQTPMGLTKYADRVEMRKVQHSGIENKIVNRLRAKGFNVVTDQKIVVYEVWTDPDFNIQLSNGKVVHGYVDHVDTHNAKRVGRDEDLRELLRKKEPGCLIVPVWVEGDSDKEADEKVAEIEQELKF